MTPDATPWLVLGGLVALAGACPLLVRIAGRNAGYVLAAGFAAGAGLLAAKLPAVVDGQSLEYSFDWVPDAGISLSLVVDGLGMLFAQLVLGIGALVMAYTARYAKPGDPHTSLYTLLTLFAASMLGLVLAADLVLLFVFWELTSITSFFLIGGDGRAGNRPAIRAFLVTALGGLALFGGILLIAVVTGTFDLFSVLDEGDALTQHSLAPAIAVLLLLGAFTKSAQVPFHFWLPGAMVAPTPVSTYLHAATMVKAGIYLLARFAPVFAEYPLWRYSAVFVGLVTAVIGAGTALKQHDLKALLAYSTVSALGFIVALVGVGTYPALVAASVFILAHALYKAALFMVVGVVDKEAGSRDIRELSGLGKVMPVTATVTALAALSMAGLPPLLGFVGKEETFAAFLDAPGAAWVAPLITALALLAAVLTFAYGARIFEGTFGGPLRRPLHEPARSFVAPAAVTAAAGLLVGLAVPILDPFVSRIASDALGEAVQAHLGLWHGFTPALALSAVTVAGGLTLFFLRHRVDRALLKVRAPVPTTPAFDRTHDELVSLGKTVGEPFLSPSPGRQLAWVFGAVVVAGALVWPALGAPTDPTLPTTRPADWAIAALLALGCLGIADVASRLAAVALLGLIGFLVAIFYVQLGAPDLALTQLLIETLTVALVILVFRRLSPNFPPTTRRRRVIAAGVGVVVGVLAGAATFLLTGRRELSEPGRYFLRAGPEEAGGSNIVNTILVDFRALDTLGEITVLGVAALGVAVLVILGRRRAAPATRELNGTES
jgi:multicomponent Na+:H+ antiporter subunit A